MESDVNTLISNYLKSLPAAQEQSMAFLHAHIVAHFPDQPLCFLDGRDANGKIVSNPNIGYGTILLKRSKAEARPFYRVGWSANQKGISMYFFGLPDRDFLNRHYGQTLGKAKITGYCIQFGKLEHVHLDTLMQAVSDTLLREA